MGKSNRLRLRDLRDAYRLIGECRDLGDDVREWREHMLRGLCRLVGAELGMGAEVREGGPSWRPALHEPVDVGWSSDAARAHFVRYEEAYGPAGDPTFLPCADLARPLVTRTREQIRKDRDWYASVEFNEYRRPSGHDDWIISLHALDFPPALHIVAAHRPLGAERFSARERRLVHVYHHELGRLLGAVLRREPQGAIAGLPPRLRRTLECLLEGDSEKQVAARLGLSRPTVHEYVMALYRRFDVSSRAELLVRCLRRRPR